MEAVEEAVMVAAGCGFGEYDGVDEGPTCGSHPASPCLGSRRWYEAAVMEGTRSGLSTRKTRAAVEAAADWLLVVAAKADAASGSERGTDPMAPPLPLCQPPQPPKRKEGPLDWERVTTRPEVYQAALGRVAVSAWTQGPGWPGLLVPRFRDPDMLTWPWFLERRETPESLPIGFWLPVEAGRRPSLPDNKELLRFLSRFGYALGNAGDALHNHGGHSYNVHVQTLRENWNEYARWDGSKAVRRTWVLTERNTHRPAFMAAR